MKFQSNRPNGPNCQLSYNRQTQTCAQSQNRQNRQPPCSATSATSATSRVDILVCQSCGIGHFGHRHHMQITKSAESATSSAATTHSPSSAAIGKFGKIGKIGNCPSCAQCEIAAKTAKNLPSHPVTSRHIPSCPATCPRYEHRPFRPLSHPPCQRRGRDYPWHSCYVLAPPPIPPSASIEKSAESATGMCGHFCHLKHLCSRPDAPAIYGRDRCHKKTSPPHDPWVDSFLGVKCFSA